MPECNIIELPHINSDDLYGLIEIPPTYTEQLEKQVKQLKQEIELDFISNYKEWADRVSKLESELAAEKAKVEKLRELIEAYRDKMNSDGLNGRGWDAVKHLNAEIDVSELERALGGTPK